MNIRLVLIGFLVIFMAGCQTIGVGNEKFEPEWIKKNVAIGKTTQREILAIYGEPVEKTTNSRDQDTWIYNKNRSGNNVLSLVSGYIPGMDTANQAASVADIKAKRGYGTTLWFKFQNGVLTGWHIG